MKTNNTSVTKCIVEISTKEMFLNLIKETDHLESMFDIGHGHDIAEQIKALVSDDIHGIQQMFVDGYAMLLLGKAFEDVEKAEMAEIVVTTRDGRLVRIGNNDIRF